MNREKSCGFKLIGGPFGNRTTKRSDVRSQSHARRRRDADELVILLEVSLHKRRGPVVCLSVHVFLPDEDISWQFTVKSHPSIRIGVHHQPIGRRFPLHHNYCKRKHAKLTGESFCSALIVTQGACLYSGTLPTRHTYILNPVTLCSD